MLYCIVCVNGTSRSTSDKLLNREQRECLKKTTDLWISYTYLYLWLRKTKYFGVEETRNFMILKCRQWKALPFLTKYLFWLGQPFLQHLHFSKFDNIFWGKRAAKSVSMVWFWFRASQGCSWPNKYWFDTLQFVNYTRLGVKR